MNTATNAEGASAQQVAKTLDSIETKLSQLGNSAKEIYMSLGIEDIIKNVLDTVTTAINNISDMGVTGFLSFITSLKTIGQYILSTISNFKHNMQNLQAGNNGNIIDKNKTLRTIKEIAKALKSTFAEGVTIPFKDTNGNPLQPANNTTNTGITTPTTPTPSTPTPNSDGQTSSISNIALRATQLLMSSLSIWAKTLETTADSAAEWSKLVSGIADTVSGGIDIAMGNYVSGAIKIISGIINAIDGGIITTSERLELLIKQEEESSEDLIEATANTQDLQDYIDNVKSAQSTMYDSEESMSSYMDAMAQMANDYPQLIDYYNAAGEAVIDLNEAEKLLLETRLKQTNAAIENAQDNVDVQKQYQQSYKDLFFSESMIGSGGLGVSTNRDSFSYILWQYLQENPLDLSGYTDVNTSAVNSGNYTSLYPYLDWGAILEYTAQSNPSVVNKIMKEFLDPDGDFALLKSISGVAGIDYDDYQAYDSEKQINVFINTFSSLFNSLNNNLDDAIDVLNNNVAKQYFDEALQQVQEDIPDDIYNLIFPNISTYASVLKNIFSLDENLSQDSGEWEASQKQAAQEYAQDLIEWASGLSTDTLENFTALMGDLSEYTYSSLESTLISKYGLTVDDSVYNAIMEQFAVENYAARKRVMSAIWDSSAIKFNEDEYIIDINSDSAYNANIRDSIDKGSAFKVFVDRVNNAFADSENSIATKYADQIIQMVDSVNALYENKLTTQGEALANVYASVVSLYEQNNAELNELMASADFTSYAGIQTFIASAEALDVNFKSYFDTLSEAAKQLYTPITTIVDNLTTELSSYTESVEKLYSYRTQGATYEEAFAEFEKLFAADKAENFNEVFEYNKLLGKYVYTNTEALEKSISLRETALSYYKTELTNYENSLTAAKELNTAEEIEVSPLSIAQQFMSQYDQETDGDLVDAYKEYLDQLQASFNLGQTALAEQTNSMAQLVAQMGDETREILEKYTSAFSNALNGTMTNQEKLGLSEWLNIEETDSQKYFQETADGLSLTREGLLLVYKTINNLTGSEKAYAKQVLADATKEYDGYKNISEIIATINELNEKSSDAKKDQYAEELELAKELLYIRSETDPDSFAIFDTELPNGFQSAEAAFNSYKDFLDALKDGDDAGGISLQSWYNFVNALSDTQLESLNFKDKSQALLQGAENLVLAADDSASWVVDVASVFGTDYTTAIETMNKASDEGMKAFAEQMVKEIDNQIKALETLRDLQNGTVISASETLSTDDNALLNYANSIDANDSAIAQIIKGKIKGLDNNDIAAQVNKDAEEVANIYSQFQAELQNLNYAELATNGIISVEDIIKEAIKNLEQTTLEKIESQTTVSLEENISASVTESTDLLSSIYTLLQHEFQGTISESPSLSKENGVVTHAADTIATKESNLTSVSPSFKDSIKGLLSINNSLDSAQMTKDESEIEDLVLAITSLSGKETDSDADSLDELVNTYARVYQEWHNELDAAAVNQKQAQQKLEIAQKEYEAAITTAADKTKTPEERGAAAATVAEKQQALAQATQDVTDAEALFGQTMSESEDFVQSFYQDLADEIEHLISENTDFIGSITDVQTALSRIPDIISILLQKKIQSGTITSGLSLFNANASGNAKAAGTLMGELGPELYVSNGQYHIAGANGAEFVNLPDDAIVFNHLQTQSLLSRGKTSRGKATTSVKKAVSYAKGNTAMASGSSSIDSQINQLKQIQAAWQRIVELNTSDLVTKSTGSGGGGSSSAETKAILNDLEQWYNLLRQIEQLESSITLEQKKRENMRSGSDYAQSLEYELAMLEKEETLYKHLSDLQKSYYDARRNDLKNSAYGMFFTYSENGLMQYNDQNFTILKQLNETNENGQALLTAAQQLDLLSKNGFDISVLSTSADGTKVSSASDKMSNFWDNFDSWIDEMDETYDSYNDYLEKIEDSISEQNAILKEYEDNQISLEEKVLTAVQDMRQGEIDNLQDSYDVLSEAANNYVNGLSDALNKEKELYENNETSTQLQQLQRKLAILQRSGGSTSDIKSLQEQIDSQLQEKYFSDQQDQIDAIKEASDNQLEALKTQIDLMTEQLEYQKENGLLWQDVYEIMNSGNATTISEFIRQYSSEYENMSAAKLQQTISEDLKSAEMYVEYMATHDKFNNFYDSINDSTLASYGVNVDDENAKQSARAAAKLAYVSEMNESGDEEQAKIKAIEAIKEMFEEQVSSSAEAITNTSKKTTNSNKTATVQEIAAESSKLGKMQWKAQYPDAPIAAYANYYKSPSDWVKAYNQLGGAQTFEDWLAEKGIPPTTSSRKAYELTYNNLRKILGYSTGGDVDYTGLAMVHGSKSHPEAFISADDRALLKSTIFSTGDNSLRAVLEQFTDFVNQLPTAYYTTTAASSGTVIENLSLNLGSDVISSDYDAKRAGQVIMDEIVKIARQTGNMSVSRR